MRIGLGALRRSWAAFRRLETNLPSKTASQAKYVDFGQGHIVPRTRTRRRLTAEAFQSGHSRHVFCLVGICEFQQHSIIFRFVVVTSVLAVGKLRAKLVHVAKIVLRLAFVWAALAAGIYVFLLIMDDNLPLARQLMDDPATAIGIVSSTTCNEHGTVRYSFPVEAKTFYGRHNSPLCAKMKAGQAIKVYFVRKNPNVNVVTDPWDIYENDMATIYLATVIMPCFLLWGTASRHRARKGARD